MITLLSPAKSLDFSAASPVEAGRLPDYQEQAARLMRKLASLSPAKLQKLQSISRDLAELNWQRNQDWQLERPVVSKSAVFAFNGDVYTGLEADKWLPEDLDFADENLRILSGLYGVLKPSDRIQPYRLEMGTRLPVARKKNLYEYWAKPLSKHFRACADKNRPIVNLASKEYFKAVEKAELSNPIYQVDFKQKHQGGYRVMSFFAKKARGRMANFIVQNRLTDPQSLKEFNLDHYYYDADRSSDRHFVFLRDKK